VLLTEDNVFLVDIRPEEAREAEGLPQLKLQARFKVAAFPLQVRQLVAAAAAAVTVAAAAAAAAVMVAAA
jgi:hypothetical protein